MKIINVKTLAIPDIKVIRFERFKDNRGYFTETFRKIDFKQNKDLKFLKNIEFEQTNESCSKKRVIRGLHFQWDPKMFKLVRTIRGYMIDLVLDVRPDSPFFGKIIAYDMPTKPEYNYGEWIYVPFGFAHGNIYPEDSVIEYFCGGYYNPKAEASISPLSKDIDWSLCDIRIKKLFFKIATGQYIISDKDKRGLSVKEWKKDERARNFIYKA